MIRKTLVALVTALFVSDGTEMVTPQCFAGQVLAANTQLVRGPNDAALMRDPHDDTDVLHYHLDVEVSNLDTDANTCFISGANKMTIQSKVAALSTFTVRLRSQFSINNVLIDGAVPASYSTDSISTRTITLDHAYGINEVFTLTIEYSGNTTSLGFGSIDVRDHLDEPSVNTESRPYYSYTWWPVKDGDVLTPGDNSDKAAADFLITVSGDFTVASNGLLQSVGAIPGNRKRYHWHTAYPTSPYLMFFSVANFNTWSASYVHSNGTMPVEFYIFPEYDTPQTRQQWEKVIPMLTLFSSLFGEYPFIGEKYGLCQHASIGGTSHQTMGSLHFDPDYWLARMVSQQWWGCSATCKTWSDIWLTEGFGTYSECLWEEYNDGFDDLVHYFGAMQARKPGNVSDSVYVYDTTSPLRIYSQAYSNRKGAWVLHQLRHVVGDTMFFQILRNYHAAFERKAATTDDFIVIATETYGQDLSWFFDQWVYQIGAPKYEFAWDSVIAGGVHYLHLTIDQTQDPSFPEVFIMPLDIEITLPNVVETISVWNNASPQRYVLPMEGPVSGLRFDPNEWVLRISDIETLLRVGDLNGDGELDEADHGAFAGCFLGPVDQFTGSCVNVDYDGDGDIDLRDWSGLQITMTNE